MVWKLELKKNIKTVVYLMTRDLGYIRKILPLELSVVVQVFAITNSLKAKKPKHISHTACWKFMVESDILL